MFFWGKRLSTGAAGVPTNGRWQNRILTILRPINSCYKHPTWSWSSLIIPFHSPVVGFLLPYFPSPTSWNLYLNFTWNAELEGYVGLICPCIDQSLIQNLLMILPFGSETKNAMITSSINCKMIILIMKKGFNQPPLIDIWRDPKRSLRISLQMTFSPGSPWEHPKPSASRMECSEQKLYTTWLFEMSERFLQRFRTTEKSL